MPSLFPPMKMVIEAERGDAKCAFYDTEMQKWSDEGVETLEARLKRWMLGTFQGIFAPDTVVFDLFSPVLGRFRSVEATKTAKSLMISRRFG